MKSYIRRSLIFSAALLLAAASVRAQTETAQSSAPVIKKIEIKHVGPAAAADELILANIRTKTGDPYMRVGVDDDIKSLYGTGFFYNIQVVEAQEEGGLTLTYVLQGKPRLVSMKFEGNKKYNDSKLLKKISSKVGEPLDEHKLFNDAEEIKKMYQKAGYPQTQVKYSVSIEESAGTGSATFEITESPKVKINSLEFDGATAFKQNELRQVMKVGRWGWLTGWWPGGKTFKQDQFDDGKEKLTDFYREHGYIDFDIKDTRFNYPTPRKVDISLALQEGKPSWGWDR